MEKVEEEVRIIKVLKKAKPGDLDLFALTAETLLYPDPGDEVSEIVVKETK